MDCPLKIPAHITRNIKVNMVLQFCKSKETNTILRKSLSAHTAYSNNQRPQLQAASHIKIKKGFAATKDYKPFD